MLPFFRKFVNDIPNKRSSHNIIKPSGGGLIFSTISIFTSLFVGYFLPLLLIPITITGFIDDLKGIRAIYRFIIQIITGLFIIKFSGLLNILNIYIENNVFLIFIILLLTIFAAAIINFVNFMDGIDGLVAGTMGIVFLAFSIKNDISVLPTALALMGFLFFNWHPSKIFMGDAGSTFLGSFFVCIVFKSGSFENSLGILLVSAPILIDCFTCLIFRFFKGHNIFKAHNTHLYQRLYKAGWSHNLISSIYIGITFFLSVIYVYLNTIYLYPFIPMIFILGLYLNKRYAKS